MDNGNVIITEPDGCERFFELDLLIESGNQFMKMEVDLTMQHVILDKLIENIYYKIKRDHL